MKKIQTTYKLIDNQRWSAYITKNEEVNNHYSIHDLGEPCSGILRHWDTKENIISFLEKLVKEIKKIK